MCYLCFAEDEIFQPLLRFKLTDPRKIFKVTCFYNMHSECQIRITFYKPFVNCAENPHRLELKMRLSDSGHVKTFKFIKSSTR